MDKIEMRLNELYDCIVKNMRYDYINAKLVLSLLDLETNMSHTVICYDVDSYLITTRGSEGKIWKNIYPILFSIFLTSVALKGNSKEDKWMSHYPLRYNLCFEILDRLVLLNTRSIQIDSDLFTEPFTD